MNIGKCALKNVKGNHPRVDSIVAPRRKLTGNEINVLYESSKIEVLHHR